MTSPGTPLWTYQMIASASDSPSVHRSLFRTSLGYTIGLIVVLAVVALVVVNALAGSPWGTFTIAATMPIAVFMGLYLRYLRPGKVMEISVLGFLLVLGSIAGLLISGTWNFLTNFLHREGLKSAWHPIFGIKILFALHVFAVAIIATKPDNANRARQLKGIAFSSGAIVLLSAVLRALSK
mgnify:CR=1 FL=1